MAEKKAPTKAGSEHHVHVHVHHHHAGGREAKGGKEAAEKKVEHKREPRKAAEKK
jgi:hypothetical protein